MISTPTLNPDAGIAFFTDGSAWYKDRTGGWAWIALDAYEASESASGFYEDTTNNQMELMAPERGLVWAFENYGPCDVLVYADSQYVVLGMNDRRRKRNNNGHFWMALEDAVDLHSTVEFCHVKGHNGNMHNEVVDDLAGKARKNGKHQ